MNEPTEKILENKVLFLKLLNAIKMCTLSKSITIKKTNMSQEKSKTKQLQLKQSIKLQVLNNGNFLWLFTSF